MHRTVSTIFVAPPAEQQLEALGKPLRTLLAKRLLALRSIPNPTGATKVEGLEHLYRIREDSYRVIYVIRGQELLVLSIKCSTQRDHRIGS
ncbi:MAG: type II toxin-antitoxin system RelE/ParE family toxin [Nitrospira sp. CG24A]|nr:MAG: type II toxin-antitoxin system RelE/ParE family toxin [Nitrospira sp. CG24A]